MADEIRQYKPDVILTQDFDGEYGHGNHMATALATADAFTLAANPNYNDGQAPWQAKKLYVHLFNRTVTNYNFPNATPPNNPTR